MHKKKVSKLEYWKAFLVEMEKRRKVADIISSGERAIVRGTSTVFLNEKEKCPFSFVLPLHFSQDRFF